MAASFKKCMGTYPGEMWHLAKGEEKQHTRTQGQNSPCHADIVKIGLACPRVVSELCNPRQMPVVESESRARKRHWVGGSSNQNGQVRLDFQTTGGGI